MDYTERLRCLAINDPRFGEDGVGGAGVESRELDPQTLALVRLAALVAVGGAVPSYGAQADAALGAGATADEIVDVLVGVVPIVGLHRVVAAAPKLAMALGYDTDDALEPPSPVGDVGYTPSRPIVVACCTAPSRDETSSFDRSS